MAEEYNGKKGYIVGIIWNRNELHKLQGKAGRGKLGAIEQVGEDSYDALATHNFSVASGLHFPSTRRDLLDGVKVVEKLSSPPESPRNPTNFSLVSGTVSEVETRSDFQWRVFVGIVA